MIDIARVGLLSGSLQKFGMTKLQKIIGIDISKSTFDVNFINSKSKEIAAKYDYTNSGIAKFIKSVEPDYHCVMEATGIYHSRLAYALVANGVKVSIINPLVIKNYSRMKMSRTKTDAKDAQLIRSYAQFTEELALWHPTEVFYEELQQIYNLIENLEKQLQMSRNQLESISHRATKSKLVEKQILKRIRITEKEIEQLSDELERILNENAGQETKNLRTVPGIGRKTSTVLLVATRGMVSFENHRQLSSYFGLCPRIYNSGTSVKGKGHICKMGLSWARKILYIASLSASQHNPICRDLYIRLLEKGKPKKVALIAVANKLLKIAFAIIKNNEPFDKNYRSELVF